MKRTSPAILSLFVFSVCTSVVMPLSVAPSDASMVDNYGLERLTDAQLAAVIGGEPVSDTACHALFVAADVGYKIGKFFGLGGLIKAGVAIEGAALQGGCER